MAATYPSTHPRQTAAHLADGVARTLRVAEALHAGNRHVDLAGFDELIGRLCAFALDLPPDQGRALRPALIALREQADRFAETLRSARPDPAPDSLRPSDGPPPDH